MRFNQLTEDDILYIKKVYSAKGMSFDEKLNELKEYLGVSSEKTVRNWLLSLGISKRIKADSPQYLKAKKRKAKKSTKKYIVTWAQNDTPVHEIFLRNIEAYAEKIGAEILVIAGRYKNPTSIFSDKDHESWHSRLGPYLYANREKIHNNVVVIGDVKVSPTAVTPMTGMKGFSGSESSVFGHPKCQEEVAETLEGMPHKRMLTTGACTVPNYTDSKAGKKGEFHHTLGFVIVEIKSKKKAFIRGVTATDEGNFNDLFYNVKFEGSNTIDVIDGLTFIGNDGDWKGKSVITKNKEIDAAVLGDMHFGDHDEQVVDTTLNHMFKKLKPKTVVLHDVFDGCSVSHHDRKDVFAQYKKIQEGRNLLSKEIDLMLECLKDFKKYKTVIVRSNHDDFLDRYLRDMNWKHDPVNAVEYLEYSTILLKGKASQGIIPYVINQAYPDMITLGLDDSYRVHDWELGQHGHIGVSGSRGSVNQFRNLNTKIIVGHSHTPSRKDGVVQVGTSTKLRLGYNKGASKWLHCHAIVHADGKAQLIVFDDGEYTTME